jgi:hypothetical protein
MVHQDCAKEGLYPCGSVVEDAQVTKEVKSTSTGVPEKAC